MADSSIDFVALLPPSGGLQRLLIKRALRQRRWLAGIPLHWYRATTASCLLVIVASWSIWSGSPNTDLITADRLSALSAPSNRPITVEGGKLARIEGTREDVQLFVVMRVK